MPAVPGTIRELGKFWIRLDIFLSFSQLQPSKPTSESYMGRGRVVRGRYYVLTRANGV